MSDEVDEVVADAKTNYDPEARLRNLSRRNGKITIFTDEPTGDKLGYAKDEDEISILGIKVGTKRVRSGVLGEIDKLESVVNPDDGQKKKLRALQKESATLLGALRATAYKFEFRAVPTVIADDVRREAKQKLEIKGKGIPEALEERYGNVSTALLLAATVTSFTDVEAGVTLDRITYEHAAALKNFLPPYEYLRLNRKLGEIQYKNGIDETVTDQADF